MAEPPRLRSLAANLALSAGSIVFILVAWLALEVGLRHVSPRYLDRFALDDINYLHVYSEAYGWVPRAGYRLQLGSDPETTINAAGYRGREVPLARTPGRTRVLMLGDSLAFGYGVGDEETSARQLELQEPRLELVNLAVQGYGTDQALLRFEREGLAFHPDAAILNFCLANDFRDNGARRAIYDGAYPKPYFTEEEDGGLVLHDEQLRLSRLQRFGLFLHQRSAVFHLLRQLVSGRPPVEAPAEEHAPARELTIRLLQRFARVAREHGVRPLIAIYPNYREFLAPSKRPGRLLAADLGDALCADLRPRLEARGVNRDTFWDYALDINFHPNARGHRVVARVLADLLREDGVLPGTAAPSAGP